MSALKNLFLHAFGHPTGILGKVGGMIMARSNRACAAWVVGLLDIRPNDMVLELGFGPGVGIELLAHAASGGYVLGVDSSEEMFAQAATRNAQEIKSGHVELRLGSAESLPFADNSFDKAMAINSLQVWTNADAGLHELRRVMKSGGAVAFGFTRHSGQGKQGLIEKFAESGFADVRIMDLDQDFCLLATKP